jgi:hypothetical protein
VSKRGSAVVLATEPGDMGMALRVGESEGVMKGGEEAAAETGETTHD